MEDRPLISVIIPVYNPGKYFYKCMDSILNQSYENLEVILVDDGSTDGSGKACDDFAERDPRVIAVHQSNQGVSKARNLGLGLAHGEFVHFPDSDDYIEKDTYAYLLEQQRKYNCDIVVFEHYITYPNMEITHCMNHDQYGLVDAEKGLRNLFTGSQFCCNKFYRKDMVSQLQFRDDILRGEDTLFAAQAISRAGNIWFDKRPLYHYVQSEESACRGKFRTNQMTVTKLYDAYRPVLSGEFQSVWIYFMIFMQEVLISLYYDVWSDVNKISYKKERRVLKEILSEHYGKIKNSALLSYKQKLKFCMFHVSPGVFCLLHKIMH